MPNYDSLQHIFLIAMPQIKDRFFAQAVVYLWEYNEKGAKGLIINKFMKPLLGDLLRHLEIPVQDQRAEIHPMLMGGPVASDQGFLLQRKHDINLKTGKTELRITIGSSKEDLQSLADGTKLEDTLVAIGFANWESGQLDEELKNNDWLVAPFNEETLFSAISGQLISENTLATWHHAAATLGVNVSDLSLDAGHA
jgi:putative transcriptional regulator